MAVTRGAGPFVGRQDELAALVELLSGLPTRGGVGLVRGRAGAGKTRLVGEALRRAAAGRVVRAAASPIEQAIAFSLAEELTRSLGDHVGTTATAHADLVERAAIDGPVVVVADDLHWADDASLLFLERVADLVDGLPVALLCLARPEPTPPGLLRLERALGQHPGAVRIDLEPLAAEDVAQLSLAVLDRPPDPDLRELLEAAAGNPFHVHEVLRAVELDPGDELVRSTAVTRAVLREVDALPDGARDLLTWAAVLGERFSVEDLACVVDRSVLEIAGPLADARAAGVLVDDGGLGFSHSLVREALLSVEPDEVVARRHRHALVALAADASDVGRWAAHLDLAHLIDLNDAPDLLRRAALAPLAVPARQRVRWLQLARDLHVDTVPADLLLDLLDCQRSAGDVEGAAGTVIALADRVAELTPWQRSEYGLLALEEHRDVDDARALLRRLADAGADDAVVKLERALDVPEGTADARGVGRSGLYWGIGWLGPAGAELADAVLRDEVASSHPRLVGTAARVVSRAEPDRAGEVLEVAMAAADQMTCREARLEVVASFARTTALAKQALPLLDGAVDEAIQLDSNLRRVVLAIRMLVHAMQGEWQTLLEEGLEAVDEVLASPSRHLDTVGGPVQLVDVLRECGRLEEATEILGRIGVHARASGELVAAPLRRRMALVVELARARLLLSQGEHDEAERSFLATEAAGEWDEVALALALGLPDVAARLVENAERLASETGVAEHAEEARFSRALIEHDATVAAFSWHSAPQPYNEGFQVDELAGDVLRSAGSREEAVERYRAAHDWFSERGGVLGAARVAARLRALGSAPTRKRGTRPDHGWAAITPAEWRTLDLVEHDLLYREIAEQLFLSRRTVESHVARASRKVAVTTRRELSQQLRHGEGAAALAAHRNGEADGRSDAG